MENFPRAGREHFLQLISTFFYFKLECKQRCLITALKRKNYYCETHYCRSRENKKSIWVRKVYQERKQ